VVLAPVAGVKSAEVLRARPGSANLQSADDGGKTNSSPRRARNKPLKPSRRKCRVFRWTCGDYRVLSTLCTRAAGATGTRRFLRPHFEAKGIRTTRAHPPRDRDAVSSNPGCEQCGCLKCETVCAKRHVGCAGFLPAQPRSPYSLSWIPGSRFQRAPD
jgi:hypothetical protein